MSAARAGGVAAGGLAAAGTASLPYTGLNLAWACAVGTALLLAGFVLLELASGRPSRRGRGD
jgi:hypothetical protein